MIVKGIELVATAVLAGLLAFVGNWLFLIPWRRAKDQHWTEQARVLFPVRIAARNNIWFIPASLTLATLLYLPDAPPWPLTAIAAVLGTIAGTLPMDREVFPRIAMPDLLRQTAIGLMLRFLVIFVFLWALTTMPSEFNSRAWALAAGILVLYFVWVMEGMVWVGKSLRLFAVAPERLQRITTETALRLNVPVKEVLLMRTDIAQAYALIYSQRLLFTERLLSLCSDGEVAAICAHEVAHLSESRIARVTRLTGLLAFLPWVLLNPLIEAFHEAAFFGLLGLTLAVSYLSPRISRKLETRADRIAKQNENEPMVYSTALIKIHQDNLIPVVLGQKHRQTHPDLYDRLSDGGLPPDFPRPAPAKAMALYGWISSVVFGILFAMYVLNKFKLIGNQGFNLPHA